MNDDGSNARPFITRSQIPGGAPATLSDPAIDESTGAVLFNTFVGTSGSINGVAVYVFKDGVITRLSRAAAFGGGNATSDDAPQPFGNGSFIFRGSSCTDSFCTVIRFETQSMSDTTADGQLETRSAWPTACDDTNALVRAQPNPVDAGQVAYSGCKDPVEFDRQLLVSGISRSGEKVVSLDDEPQKSPTWRADGGQLAAIEQGGDAGIFVYDPTDDTRDKRRVLALPSYDFSLETVDYLGAGTLLFDERVGEETRLMTISADCDACPLSSATTLKADAGARNFDPAWTPRARSQGVGAPTPAPGPGPGPRPSPAPTGAAAPGSRGELQVQAEAQEPAGSTVKASLRGGLPLHDQGLDPQGRQEEVRPQDGHAAPSPPGQAATLKLKIPKKAVRAGRKALRRGKKVRAELVLTAYYNNGATVGGPLIRTVTLR